MSQLKPIRWFWNQTQAIQLSCPYPFEIEKYE
jgi:hypothetical protein